MNILSLKRGKFNIILKKVTIKETLLLYNFAPRMII